MLNEYISSEEVEKFEGESVDKSLIKEAKEKVVENFSRIKFKEAISNMEQDFEKDEVIIDHVSGCAIDSTNQRSILAIAGPGCYLSNPMFFEWAAYSTFVNTNKNLYIFERGMYGVFIKSFKLKENSVKVYIDKNIILEAEKEDGKKYNIYFDIDKKDRVLEAVGEKAEIITGQNKKTKWQQYQTYIIIAEFIAAGAFFIFMCLYCF